jgi:biopolymer transport protein ExbD
MNQAADDKLTGAQRAKIRRLSAPHEPDPSEEAGELNIVPFLDIITNVLMFVLASITTVFTLTIDADAPKGSGGGVKGKVEESLNLTIIIAREGYFVKGKSASIAPGCRDMGAGATVGATVPMIAAKPEESAEKGQKYDPEGLQKCVRFLKDNVPQAESEEQVMIAANPNTPFQEIVRVMDVVRQDSKGTLFPNVVFTVK